MPVALLSGVPPARHASVCSAGAPLTAKATVAPVLAFPPQSPSWTKIAHSPEPPTVSLPHSVPPIEAVTTSPRSRPPP